MYLYNVTQKASCTHANSCKLSCHQRSYSYDTLLERLWLPRSTFYYSFNDARKCLSEGRNVRWPSMMLPSGYSQ